MFRKDDERHGDIRHGNGADIRADAAFRRQCSFRENLHKGKRGYPVHRLENREIDDAHCLCAGDVAERRKDRRQRITGEDADDERDHLHHLFAVDGADDGDRESEQGADQAENGIEIHNVTARIAYGNAAEGILDSAARQRKADERDRRPDDRRGHDFIDPLDAHKFDDDRNDDIHEPRKHGADQQAEVPHRHGDPARECRAHRTDKRERTAEEYRAAEFCKKKIDERSGARAEQRRRNGHVAARCGVDLHRHRDRRGEDCEQLLQREQDQLPGFGSVFYSVNQVHW